MVQNWPVSESAGKEIHVILVTLEAQTGRMLASSLIFTHVLYYLSFIIIIEWLELKDQAELGRLCGGKDQKVRELGKVKRALLELTLEIDKIAAFEIQ